MPIEHISLFSYDTVGKRKRTLTSSGAAAKAAAAATATVPAPALVRPKALKERSQNVKPPAKKQKPAPPPPQPQPAPVVVVVEEHSGLNLTVLSGSSGGGEEEEEDDNSSGEQEESQPCTEREIDAFRGKLNALLTGVRVEQSAALALHPQSPRQARALLQQLHDDGLFFINEGFVYRV